MIFISVDLPAPFSPTRPWISPAASEKSTPRSAVTPPKLLVTSESAITSGGMGSGTGRSDQEVAFHPHHAGGVGLGDHRAIDDDVLWNPALAGLFARNDRGDASDDRAAMDAAGRIAHRGQHPAVADRGERRRHRVAAANLDVGAVVRLHHVV